MIVAQRQPELIFKDFHKASLGAIDSTRMGRRDILMGHENGSWNCENGASLAKMRFPACSNGMGNGTAIPMQACGENSNKRLPELCMRVRKCRSCENGGLTAGVAKMVVRDG